MNLKPTIYHLNVIGVLIISGLFITPLLVGYELHDPTRIGKIFFFAQWMLLVIPTGTSVGYPNRKQSVSYLTVCVLLWGIWIVVRGKAGGIWHDEKFFWFAGCFAFYFLTTTILKGIIPRDWQQLILIPLVVIVLVAASEAVFGIMQLYGMAPVYHGQFKITGHFFNPAPYAGFLVASLPFALLLSAVRPNTILNRTIYWSGYLSVCLILVAIPSTRSRAAYLGLAAVLLLWFFFRYHPLLYLKRVLNTPLKRKFAYWVAPLLLVAVLTTLYLFKKDSASGRLLIWKVAAHTIAERPLTGHGFNTAQATLAPAQANYFVTGSGTEREQMLAGSVRWVFNEFLQIASETGLIGLALFLLVVGFALLYKLPASLSLQNRLAIGAARASVVGILVFGCFSYPFYSLPVTLLFFFSLAILAALQPNLLNRAAKVYNPILKPVLFAGIIALSVFYIRQIPKLKQAYWLWDEAGQLYQMGAYTEANESFAEAYPVLSHNGLFLQQYGKSLAMEEEYTQAIEILCQATSYYNDEFTGITLGNCYQAIGDYANAETQYLLAANTVPHKFYPLYLLAKLYNESGQTEKATAMAKELLRKEIKVPSKAIEEIKAEMQQLIDNNASLQISNKPKEKGRKPVCANKALPAWALPLQERR